MISNRNLRTLGGMCLLVVAALTACAASPAPKVRCDGDLRPINSAAPERPLP